VAGRLYLRLGFRPTSIIGGVILVVAISGLAVSTFAPSVWLVAIVAGFGFAAVTSLVAAQSSVDWNERGVVTGTQMFFRSIGQALGAAILGAIANSVILAHGGDETDPATMAPAAGAVFLAAAVVAALLLAFSIAMPSDRRAPAPAVDAD